MRPLLLLIITTALIPGCCANHAPWAQQSSVITDFGAVADGTTLNTRSIQAAIDHVAAAGGGTIVIPRGVFLSGAIFLKPGVNLDLEKDAVLKGSTNVADYPVTRTRIEGHFQPWLPALVNADQIDHLRIWGEGTLDGSGKPFWDAFRSAVRKNRATKNLDVPRPRLMFIQKSSDVQVAGIHFKDSGFWNLHLYHCRDVLLDGLNIQAGAGSPSTDGTDVDSCQNVTIRGCYFAVNDDCIALKGSKGPFALADKDSPPVQHIRISDCTFARGGSLVTLGSEATIVRDVVADHCTIAGPGTRSINMARLKLRPDTPQTYEDIHFNDITLDGAGRLISIEPWRQYFDLQGQKSPPRTVRNLTITNVHGTFGSFGIIDGNPGDVIEHVAFKNIDVKLNNATPRIVRVNDLVLDNVKINGTAYPGPPHRP